jgi:hypothetical protein
MSLPDEPEVPPLLLIAPADPLLPEVPPCAVPAEPLAPPVVVALPEEPEVPGLPALVEPAWAVEEPPAEAPEEPPDWEGLGESLSLELQARATASGRVARVRAVAGRGIARLLRRWGTLEITSVLDARPLHLRDSVVYGRPKGSRRMASYARGFGIASVIAAVSALAGGCEADFS